MLALFRTNQSFASLLLFGYALLLQVPALVFGPPEPPGVEWTYFGGWLHDVADGTWLALLLPPVLLALAGIAANYISDRYRFSATSTQFPGLVLILMWGVVPAFHAFHPAQVGNLFLLLSLGALGSTYKSQTQDVARFNAGWWIGLAALLLPSYLLFVPAFIVGISIFSTAGLRHITQLLTGILIAWFLGGTVAYLNGAWPEFLEGQLAAFGFGTFAAAGSYDLIGLALLLVAALVTLVSGGNSRVLLSLEGAKNISFIYWVLLFTAPVAFGSAVTGVVDAQVILPPLGILLGLWLARRNEAQAEFYHLLVFVAALVLTVMQLRG